MVNVFDMSYTAEGVSIVASVASVPCGLILSVLTVIPRDVPVNTNSFRGFMVNKKNLRLRFLRRVDNVYLT